LGLYSDKNTLGNGNDPAPKVAGKILAEFQFLFGCFWTKSVHSPQTQMRKMPYSRIL